MKDVEGGGVANVTFTSVAEAIDFLSVATVQTREKNQCDKNTHTSMYEGSTSVKGWYGTDSYNEALRLGAEGMQDPYVEEIAYRFAHEACEYTQETMLVSDVEGGAVDPSLLWSGVPEAFARPEEKAMADIGYEAVEIVVNSSVSYSVNPDAIRARGALALSVAMLAEQCGVPSRVVWGCAGNDRTNEQHLFDATVILKDFAQWPDWSVLAFWLINPAAFRRLGFRFTERAHKTPWTHSYGMPKNSAWKGMDRSKMITFNHGRIRDAWRSPEAVVQEAKRLLLSEGKMVSV